MSAVIKFFIWILSFLPLPVIHFFGAIIGWLFYLVPNKRLSTSKTNIDLCFPDYSKTRRSSLLKQSMIETGKAVAETGGLWLWSNNRVLRLAKEVTGGELLEQAMASGKGCIIAAPHLGCWELVGLYCSLRFPITSLYRPPPLTGMGKLMRSARERVGARLVPTDRSGVKALHSALAKGEMVGILPDHDPSTGGGVFAPFFGVQANTMTLLSRLAAKSGATVIFGYAERLPYGLGYRLHFKKGSENINNRDINISCTAVNRGVEECIREIPAQYFWCYKRFRSRPEGEPSFYKK